MAALVMRAENALRHNRVNASVDVPVAKTHKFREEAARLSRIRTDKQARIAANAAKRRAQVEGFKAEMRRDTEERTAANRKWREEQVADRLAGK